MGVGAVRLVRYLVTTVLAAGVTAALVLQPGGDIASDDGPGVVSLTDVQLAAVQADAIFLSVPAFTGGDTTDPKHLNMSTALSVSAGVGKAAIGAKPVAEPVLIQKPVDAYTTQFSLAVSSGKNIPTVSLYFNKNADKPIDVMAITLTNVMVMRSAEDFAVGSEALETVRLAFSKIQMTYRKVNSNGTITPFIYCWDYEVNASCAG